MKIPDRSSALYKIRHSASHITSQAVKRLFPGCKQTIGPVTEDGFFAELQTTTPLKESDLVLIEEEMLKIIAQDLEITGQEYSKAQAKDFFHDNPFKHDLIDKIPQDQKITIYTQGEYSDLCQGGHTDKTGEVKYFKLTNVAGSYWKGDASNAMLQRVFGVAFESKQELDGYLEKLELAKKYDHRLIGKQLGLFSFMPQAPGMAFFKPKGLTLYNTVQNIVRDIKNKYDYLEIKTPIILKEELWHQSGHYDNYRANMFFSKAGEDSFCVRPMSCPGAMLLFDQEFYSHNDLPLRLAEFGLVHRYELSGVLHGLMRVRAFTQDDTHIFCRQDMLASEISRTLGMILEVYQAFGLSELSFALSTRPENSIGDDLSWEKATQALHDSLVANKLEFIIQEGEGAFYGPKLEIHFKDSLGRQWQCGTIQIDYFMPQRFDLKFVDSDQSKQVPVVLHIAVIGSLERFMGILLEHYQGKLPLKLAPLQIEILTINENVLEYANSIKSLLQNNGYRVSVNSKNDTISAKIRTATLLRVPVLLVIGEKELQAQTVAIRNTLDGTSKVCNLSDLLSSL